MIRTPQRIYLDYNASAPLRPEARDAVIAALELTGNPSSVHGEGRRARTAVETARQHVAELVGARPSEVVFTSGATEANNWALAGNHHAIVLAGIEHESVLAPARRAAASVVDVRAGSDGVIVLECLARELLDRTPASSSSLVAMQLANNETGVIQPVAKAAGLAHEHGFRLHCDAAQAAGRIAIDFAALGADTLALSSHKLGGPKGAGALVVRSGIDLSPLVIGGGQERRRRAGTENAAAIAGFAAAAKLAAAELANVSASLLARRTRLERAIQEISPDAIIVGVEAERLCNTSLIALPGCAAETLVIKFDLAGIAISAGAACSSGKVGPSHVLAAMGCSSEIQRSAIRVSLGPTTSDDEIDTFLQVWRTVVAGSALRRVA